MIFVDSSVWIGHLRGADSAAVWRLRRIDAGVEPLLVGDLVLMEVLQGARDEGHAARIRRGLEAFPMVGMLDTEVAVAAAANYRALRGRGITVRKMADLVIGTFCIELGHRLLHDDRDFAPMVAWLGLGVV